MLARRKDDKTQVTPQESGDNETHQRESNKIRLIKKFVFLIFLIRSFYRELILLLDKIIAIINMLDKG